MMTKEEAAKAAQDWLPSSLKKETSSKKQHQYKKPSKGKKKSTGKRNSRNHRVSQEQASSVGYVESEESEEDVVLVEQPVVDEMEEASAVDVAGAPLVKQVKNVTNHYSTTCKEWFNDSEKVLKKYGYVDPEKGNEEHRKRTRIFLELLRTYRDRDLALKNIVDNHTLPFQMDRYVMAKEAQADKKGVFRRETQVIKQNSDGTRKYGFYEIMSRLNYKGDNFIYHRFLREVSSQIFVEKSMSEDSELSFDEYFDRKENEEIEKFIEAQDSLEAEQEWQPVGGGDWIEESDDYCYIFSNTKTGIKYYLVKD
jgi:Tfp pilus assembly major pilin PilA